MIVKRGSVVTHAVAQQWGIGKVVEVNDVRATIRFNDGSVRKIISSHFNDLQPADPASYLPPVKEAQGGKGRGARKGLPKVKKAKKQADVTV